jgi:nucleoside phosphorylase
LPSARHLRPQLCHLSNIIDHGIVIYDLLNIIDHSIVICQHHNLDSDPAHNDENLYALGSIAGRNVAIVCLPAGRIGKNPAAAVFTQMRATFKAISFGLMVGIGGGVPTTEADIRLGDVVVSQPHGSFGGVVHYDMGRTTASGFERRGALNSPPQTLLAAATKVRAKEMRKHVSGLERITKFQCSKAGPDVLFEAAYGHEGGHTCDGCNVDRHEARQARKSEEEVVVHYGTIASGNQVMQSAVDRLEKARGSLAEQPGRRGGRKKYFKMAHVNEL